MGARVFAFGGAASDDIRDNVPEHGVEILAVDEDGGIDFIVYGRMNRGTHEGSTGIAYYHYDMGQNALEEKFFYSIVGTLSGVKKMTLGTCPSLGTNGIFYFYMDHGIYGIDLKSLEYVAPCLRTYKRAVRGQRGPFRRHGRRIPGSGILRRSRS